MGWLVGTVSCALLVILQHLDCAPSKTRPGPCGPVVHAPEDFKRSTHSFLGTIKALGFCFDDGRLRYPDGKRVESWLSGHDEHTVSHMAGGFRWLRFWEGVALLHRAEDSATGQCCGRFAT